LSWFWLPASWTLDWRPPLCSWRSLRALRETRFVVPAPKSWLSGGTGTTGCFSEQWAFHKAHEKDHATPAKAAKAATESPPTCFLEDSTVSQHPPHQQRPFIYPSRSLVIKGVDTRLKPRKNRKSLDFWIVTQSSYKITALQSSLLKKPLQKC